MKKNYSQKEWLHEVLSFVLLLHTAEGDKTLIYKNSAGVYCARTADGALPFDGADTLYSAFGWFHSNLEKYADMFSEAYKKDCRNFSFGHYYPVSKSVFRIRALQEAPKAYLQNRNCSLTPFVFYKLLFKALDVYRPGLFSLDLNTDIANQKRHGTPRSTDPSMSNGDGQKLP